MNKRRCILKFTEAPDNVTVSVSNSSRYAEKWPTKPKLLHSAGLYDNVNSTTF